MDRISEEDSRKLETASFLKVPYVEVDDCSITSVDAVVSHVEVKDLEADMSSNKEIESCEFA